MQNLEIKIKDIIEGLGYIFYDMNLLRENEKQILRIQIDAKHPITHDDCQKVSEIISPFLDVENPINGEYFLEISSKGLERNLTKTRHFECSLGEKIEIKLKDKQIISGILDKANSNGIGIDGQFIEYENIKKAKIIYEL